MVFSTAFGTAIFGLLIDQGFTIEYIALVPLLYKSITIGIVNKSSIEPIIFQKNLIFDAFNYLLLILWQNSGRLSEKLKINMI